MRGQCRVSGCTGDVESRWGDCCEKHKKADRRHGDPRQVAVRKHLLKPFNKHISETIKKDKTGKIEAGLKQIKNMVEDEAKHILNDSRPMKRETRTTAHAMLTVAQSASAVDMGCIVGAVFLLQEATPRTFVSDRAFLFQLARSFQRLAPVNTGSYWNQSTGKTHQVYRDMPPRATEALAAGIKRHYMPFIVEIMKRACQETQRAEEAAELIKKGFKELD